MQFSPSGRAGTLFFETKFHTVSQGKTSNETGVGKTLKKLTNK